MLSAVAEALSVRADWTHSRKDAARGFADLAVEHAGGKPIVREFVPHSEGLFEIDLKHPQFKDISDQDMAHFLEDLKDEGVRTVKIHNANDSVGADKPGPVYAILDQGATRDVKANFDPAYLGKPGLMKALAGLGIVLGTQRGLNSEAGINGEPVKSFPLF